MIQQVMIPWREDAPALTDEIARSAIGRPVVGRDDRVLGTITDAYVVRNPSFGSGPLLGIKYELTETDGDGSISLDVALGSRGPAALLARFVPSMRVVR